MDERLCRSEADMKCGMSDCMSVSKSVVRKERAENRG